MIDFIAVSSDSEAISLYFINTVHENELTGKCKDHEEWDNEINRVLKTIEVMRDRGHTLLKTLDEHRKLRFKHRYFGSNIEHLGKFCEYHDGNIITIYPDKISIFGTEEEAEEDVEGLSEEYWEARKKTIFNFFRLEIRNKKSF